MKPVLLSVTGNPLNQDRGLVVLDGPRAVMCVADGAGGRSGGAEAAQMAIEFVRMSLASIRDADSCVSLLRKMDADMCADPVAGETTCVLAVAESGVIFGASVGDSGAWVMLEGGSHVDLMKGQQRKPFVGTGCARPMPFRYIGAGRVLLMATDGLLKYNSAEQISTICLGHPPDDATQELVRSVRYLSGNLPDDVTVLVGTLGD